MNTLSVPLMIMTVINNISKFDKKADAEQVHDVGVTWFCKHILHTVHTLSMVVIFTVRKKLISF